MAFEIVNDRLKGAPFIKANSGGGRLMASRFLVME